MKKIILSICCPIVILSSLFSQPEKPLPKKGGSFNFENFQSSNQSLYKEIDQTKIKAMKLSFREIYDTVEINNYLFNPKTKEGNRISLAGLLFQAIKEGNVPVYAPTSPYNSDFFAGQISWGDIIKENNPQIITGLVYDSLKDTITVPDDIDPAEIKSYLLLEATIYNLKNQVISVRPIGLCPIRANMDAAIGRKIKRQLFWVYFPDIMSMLSNHYPEVNIKGVKTTLDFFTKNRYVGDYFTFYHTNSPLLEGQLFGDTTRFVQGFDVDWIYKQINEGFFVNPYDSFYQGVGEKEVLPSSDVISEHDINPALVACAKYVYKTINLREIENYPLYFPESAFLTEKSLIDVIYNEIKDGKIVVSQAEDSIPMTFHEVEAAMGAINVAVTIQTSDGNYRDSVLKNQAISSEVKKYILKEAEFFDVKGTLIDSRILGLIPVREWSDEPDPYEIIRVRTYQSKLFYVPFSNPEFRMLLSQNYACRFTTGDNLSFLSFFQNRKYKTENIDTEPAAVSTALRECGIQPAETTYNVSFEKDLTIKPEDHPKIVFREVNNKDSVNYQLFQPAQAMNGLISFFDLLMSGIEKEAAQGYVYNTEGEFASQLNLSYIKRITKTSEDTIIVIDAETGKEYLTLTVPDKPIIKKYIIKEIHTGSAIYILGVCPVLEYFEENDYDKKYPKMANTFWIPFTKKLRQELLKREIVRINCEPEKTFGEYFAKNSYRGNIIGEKVISVSEAEQIIRWMNR